jgi:hypothetical protein
VRVPKHLAWGLAGLLLGALWVRLSVRSERTEAYVPGNLFCEDALRPVVGPLANPMAYRPVRPCYLLDSVARG